MAFGVLERSDADIAVALQVLRDRAVEQKKAHRHAVWIVIARKDDGFMECRKVFFFESGRKNIRDSSTAYALKWLIELVEIR